MSSSGVRDRDSTDRRTKKAITDREADLINSYKTWDEATSLSSLAGGGTQSSGEGSAPGNFMPRKGDNWLGQYGNQFEIVTIENGIINVSKESGSSSPMLIVNPEGGLADFLDTLTPGTGILFYQEQGIHTVVAEITIRPQLTLSITNIVGIGGNIVEVTVADTSKLTTGDKVDIDNTTNFDIVDAIITVTSGTTFTYDLGTIASTTPETSGDVTRGNIVTQDGENLICPINTLVHFIFNTITQKFSIDALTIVSGATTGTFISADLIADQTANLAVGDHIEFDRNATPTGADGEIVLQTGAGQANGIFELIAEKTYFLSGVVSPIKSAATQLIVVWFDITNATEIGRRTVYDVGNAINLDNQPKAEIIFTPATNVNVELRIVALSTPANLTGFFAVTTYAHIFEFSGKNGADGAAGASGAVTWKTPARAKTIVDISNLALFDVITDGVTLVENNRVLLTAQTTTSENGLYVVGVVAAGFAPLTRPTDFDTDAEVLSETFVAIEEGSAHANQLWHLITNNPILIDVTGQLWDEFAPGTSGGPNIGGDVGGEDATGQFVYDGRIAIGFDRLKKWEQINNFLYPDNGVQDLIYLQSQVANPTLNGRLVMCGLSNQTRGASFSDNYGATWTLSTGMTSNANFIRMAYDPIGDVLVVVANDAINEVSAIRVSTSRGTSFAATALAAGTFTFQDVIFSADDSLFVAVDSTPGANRIFTSPDGNIWTQQTAPAAVLGGWFRIVYNSTLDLYVVKGNSATDVMTSPDAINWTIGVTNISVSLPRRMIASDGQSKIVAMSPTVGTFHTSDGINWVQFNTMPNVTVIENLLWAPDLSLWLAIGTSSPSSATPPIFWASNDAEEWFQMPINTMRQNDEGKFGVGNVKIAVAYAEEWGYFFGCGGDATTTTPFTANALFWRTAVFFNGQEDA